MIPPSPSTQFLATHSATFLAPVAPTGTVSNGNGILLDQKLHTVCPGNGLDAASAGVIAALLLFAALRPRFRQVYGPREWFVPPESRPKPLGSGFFAFLNPPVPIVPDVSQDVHDAGRSASRDAQLFPSDEQLSQRTLLLALFIAIGWSILALGGALPMYLVNTPCHTQLPTHTTFGGDYSSLQDLSLIRLLRLFDEKHIQTTTLDSLSRRALIGDPNDPANTRLRIIILTAITLVLALLPALWAILQQFNIILDYRKRWLQIKCEGKDLGWLSSKSAPGFQAWGEKRFKSFIKNIGLTSGMDEDEREARRSRRNDGRHTRRKPKRREEEAPLYGSEKDNEVDIQCLFSVSDTQHIALLIDQRDEILENLEIAEAHYINSFQVTTPDPSVLDFEPHPPPPLDPSRPYISRPLPLGQGAPPRTKKRRAINRAYGTTSLAPTSFVAHSSFYRLRGVNGLSGGRLRGSNTPSFTESISSRIVGSRFLEINRNSATYGRLTLGNRISVDRHGQLGPSGDQEAGSRTSWIPDPRLYGPNWGAEPFNGEGISEHPGPEYIDEHGVKRSAIRSNSETIRVLGENTATSPGGEWWSEAGCPIESETMYNGFSHEEDWVDLEKENGPGKDFNSDFNGLPPSAGPSKFRRRPPVPEAEAVSSSRRETFPLRRRDQELPPVPPPHLRLQQSQPFVRPLDGLNFEDLGHVYEDITHWRSQLKSINSQILDAQKQSYDDIAEGKNIRGWLIVGRGLRHLPGVEVIEGRAKEDIRWDVLQNERTLLDRMVFWTIVCIVAVLLAVGLTAAAGLAVSPAPDVVRSLPFLEPLQSTGTLASGIATVLLPAVAATLFIVLAVYLIHLVANIHGSISRSSSQLFIFKTIFYFLVITATMFLTAAGGLLFALQAFVDGSRHARSIASGSIYITVLILAIVILFAVIVPGLLLLQPIRLWNVLRAEQLAVTPRQRFRAVYPRTYDPTFALSSCILALMFASTFSLIFPIITPAVVLLLLLNLVAHRYLIGYVYARMHSQTGGLLQLWLLKRFATLCSFQPILLGSIFLSRRIWIEGGISIGTGVAVMIFAEIYATLKLRLPGRGSLRAITRDSLDHFARAAERHLEDSREEMTSENDTRGHFTRGSMASVLDMMSLTLAVKPSAPTYRGPVPLPTETLDDLIATERAARTHPDTPPHLPPHLPPLPFSDHADDMAGILYAPELIAPCPIIWLPRDSADVAESEAADLKRYHALECTLDVKSKDSLMRQRSSSSRGRRAPR
ncbi:hypothetical protein AGABI1DRAFT_124299 [Agaricus bisporus var. burnettii JB137-S8]|uniref:CSC1/OSCA1-like 7TM region domain-containing protein n=1 Tax=Agaricus bisporus var. burnettii (strain JB137-S8 / ATCC MYA-4627 / FGSC 10392) TaxID=597362 RepID=K5X7T3_AGABU|nr:uncharacterized protein AGABI1DRAFT_124299 [Agaricus bisporus var. burnettii JB137-S8]EKM83976.1 hypothetical protein AGABI1DRAFT_124299 [Agaricus bisporus var. burnettii JB137-S8]